jgi:hypothetical protein
MNILRKNIVHKMFVVLGVLVLIPTVFFVNNSSPFGGELVET